MKKAEAKPKYGSNPQNKFENPIIKVRQAYAKLLSKLPTFFRLAKLSRKRWKESNESFLGSFKNYPTWQLPMEIGIFENPKLKQTKRNLRHAFKDSPRKLRVINGEFNYPMTVQVYCNETIQNLFEFSLHYSHLSKTTLTAAQAKRLFIKATAITIDLPLKNSRIPNHLKEIIEFMNGEKGFLKMEHFPSGNVGRTKGVTEHTKTIERLINQGFTDTDIVDFLFPHRYPEDKKQLKETVKKARQRIKKGGK